MERSSDLATALSELGAAFERAMRALAALVEAIEAGESTTDGDGGAGTGGTEWNASQARPSLGTGEARIGAEAPADLDCPPRTSQPTQPGPAPLATPKGASPIPVPSPHLKAWSRRHACCVRCGLSTSPHASRGVCFRCYQAGRKATQSVKAPTTGLHAAPYVHRAHPQEIAQAERVTIASSLVRTVVSRQEREFEFRRLMPSHVPTGVDPDGAQRILAAIHAGTISHYAEAHAYWSAMSEEERDACDRYALDFMTAGYVPPKPKKERSAPDQSRTAAATGDLLRGR